MLCALLIFQDPDLPEPLARLSPWLDMLTRTRADVFAQLAAQAHRRFIKTHTPLDGLPVEEQVTYVCVGRDPRDAAISMFHHRANLDVKAAGATLHRVALAEGREMLSLPAGPPPPTVEAYFWHFVDDPTPATQSNLSLLATLHHYELALNAREHSNVVVLHYGDLKRDLEKEMRRLAERLAIAVPESRWPRLVQAASFESMRARGAALAPESDLGLWKEPARFFRSGAGGHWREFFDEAAEQRYEARVASLASPEVAAWAHSGWQAAAA
jgi:hypothetical protein